ncbi:MAG: ribonuclease H [Nitrospirales bacterium]|nr:MAG: ribonuclease H [Nitrospirales bacterium]
MCAQTLAIAFRHHLESYGISSTMGTQVPYGQKLVVANSKTPSVTRTLIIYDGKKGPRIVFEGNGWPEELQTYVQTLWQRFQSTRTVTTEGVSSSHDGRVVMYVDGSYQDTKGTPCIGWAFEAWHDGKSVHCDSGVLNDPSVLSLRNVAGECEAARQGLQWCHDHAHRTVEVRYDYQGVAAWPTRSWKAKLPFTQQYAKDIHKLAEHLSISWTHVRGHNGEVGNERVDQLAREAMNHQSSL